MPIVPTRPVVNTGCLLFNLSVYPIHPFAPMIVYSPDSKYSDFLILPPDDIFTISFSLILFQVLILSTTGE